MDAGLLARLQFAFTVMYHFLFVPLSIGIGLIVVLTERKYYKSGLAEDRAASDLMIKLFTATFAVGVATGITMEFAFGTNWAVYSRFVGDIFGAPLAAEALFAFFLESTFLGVLLFGRAKVSKRFYYVSTWLVWLGSMLSALWIIIANSWMQTPAGFEVVGGRAVLTNFFAAAFNPTTVPRYLHTIIAVLMMGGFAAIGLAAYYMRRGDHPSFARKLMASGIMVAFVFTILMLPAGDHQAVAVMENQPSKIATMEGHWDKGPMPLGIVGWIDYPNRKTYSIEIPGGASFLATGSFSTPWPGLNDFKPEDIPTPIQGQITYQSYHLMIMLWGVMLLIVGAVWWMFRSGRLEKSRGMQTFLMWATILPMLAIQTGWATAEVGRQPWIVWEQLRTAQAYSLTVPAYQVVLTLVLFVAIYTLIYVAWWRVVSGILKKGPATASAGAKEVSS